MTPARTTLIFAAAWLALSAIIVTSCRLARSPSGPAPASSSTPGPVDQLRADVARARLLVGAAGLACLALAPADREPCQQGLNAARATLSIADTSLATAEACAEGDQRCVEAASQAALDVLPRVVALVEQLGASPAASSSGR